jgi:hypothetical protein
MAHIKDRANNYKEEYYDKVKEDFTFAETINDRFCLGIMDDGSLVMVQKSMQKCFDEYVVEPASDLWIKEEYLTNAFRVDMDKMDCSHPMYEFLKEHGGIYSASNMETFLHEIYTLIFQDVNKYKQLRDYIIKIDFNRDFDQMYSLSDQIKLNLLLYHMFPFLDSFNDDEEKLMKKWPRIAERWFLLNNTTLPRDLLLIQGYTLLDMHPLFSDKLKKNKNTLDNIIRDGNHCFYASNARYFISEDEYTRKKTAFLYGAYGINTIVVSESEFFNYIEC